jgi:HEAT repeat protein
MVSLLAGCQQGAIEAKLDQGFKKLFAPRLTPQQYMLVAVSSEDPDARRDAVARISGSKQYNREWAIKGFVAIALLESEPQTRCVAIRALARTGDPRATETMLRILNYQDQPPQEVWPPVGLVRWDATMALADLSASGKIPEEYREQVYKTLLAQLRLDQDRHARIAAARGLAGCPQEGTVAALIAGLRDADFAVAHQCEESLVRLTGCTHHADAFAWQEWLEANQAEVFAHAGEIPESRRPPYRNRWEKASYDTMELVRWLWPGSKEE